MKVREKYFRMKIKKVGGGDGDGGSGGVDKCSVSGEGFEKKRSWIH